MMLAIYTTKGSDSLPLYLRSICDKEELITRIIAIKCENMIAFCLCPPKNYINYLIIEMAYSYHLESSFHVGERKWKLELCR